ncbi:MAG TPA: hypothetical protein V6D47_03575 [Oscillatoriaceae cyanobacterium]
MAHILHKEGLIDDAQMDLALRQWYARHREGVTAAFGQIVLQLGYVTREELAPYVALQAELTVVPGRGKPLGAMLIESGMVKPSRLVEALRVQRETGKRLGEVLVELGLVSRAQIAPLLRLQGRRFTNILTHPSQQSPN